MQIPISNSTALLSRIQGTLRVQVLLAALPLALTSCSTLQLISNYDEVTDQSLTSIQKKTDDFIVALKKNFETSEGAFDKHSTFYEHLDRDLRQLEFRVASIPNNHETVSLVAKVRAALLGTAEEKGSLKDVHSSPSNRNNGSSTIALEIAHRHINQTIKAALMLELKKKQGLESNQ